jgi:hypothetical protein
LVKILDGFYSLFSKVNRHKTADFEVQEGAFELLDELKLEMPDEDLISLKDDWLEKWSKYYASEIKPKQDENEKYWLGKHFEVAKVEDRSVMDNVIFEAVETFLPIATKRNPEPTVRSDNTEEGESIAKKVQSMLVYQADVQRIKLKLKKVCRFWAIYLLGAVEISWSLNENDIRTEAIRPQRFILDPDGTIDEDMQYTGEYAGKYCTETASKLVKRFPKSAEIISKAVNKKMGSKVTYIKWMTEDYWFWTLGSEILGKIKNPHWNHAEEEIATDEYGVQAKTGKMIPGKNHFNYPKIPLVFLSIFNLGKHPFDDTSLIGQNLANQDIINKRQAQIDRNIDGINGGWIISGERSGLTQEQSTMAIEACRQGGGLWIAQGDPNTAVSSKQAQGLPGDVFNHLTDTREELRNIFGVRGSSPQGTMNEQTLGGKMIIKDQDSSRIGGGISEYLEQFCDQVFNWWVQMMYVYYDEEHLGSIVGKDRAAEFISLSNAEFGKKLSVSVKEGSLLPKDEFAEANTALTLAGQNLIDPISLYDKLGLPNPQESAERLYIWLNSPQLLFPEAARASMMANQAKMAEEAATQMTIAEQAAVGQKTINEPSPEEADAKGELEHKRKLELQNNKSTKKNAIKK